MLLYIMIVLMLIVVSYVAYLLVKGLIVLIQDTAILLYNKIKKWYNIYKVKRDKKMS